MKNTNKSWAETECEKFKDQHSGDYYLDACVESALKAYECLDNDGHSGASIGYTKWILNRLIDRKPLFPIIDDQTFWIRFRYSDMNNRTCDEYQCSRCTSLFKKIYHDGTVKYHDNDRVLCVSSADPSVAWNNGFVQQLIDNMFPITMPYFPPDTPIKAYCEEFLSIKAKINGVSADFDTLGVLYCINDGDKIDICRFFRKGNDGWVEIDKEEYNARKPLIGGK